MLGAKSRQLSFLALVNAVASFFLGIAVEASFQLYPTALYLTASTGGDCLDEIHLFGMFDFKSYPINHHWRHRST